MAAAVAATCLLLPSSVSGQVDPSGSWRTWHTEHFRVHAKASLREHAERAAREAERAYAALAAELRPPRGKIELVLSDDADYSNGLATVIPSNRLTVYLTPPATSGSVAVYDSWLRLVITHELTHVFHLDRAEGIWRVLQRLFGRAPGLFPNAYQPEWVIEGLATYYESRFTTAGRLRGAFHDQLLAAAAGEGRWPLPGDATGVNRVWPAGARPYAWGSRFFDSQRVQHGDSIVPRFVARTSRQLVVFNVSSPMHAAGGDRVEPGWKRLLGVPERAGGARRVLDSRLRVQPRPRVSPDGTRVAYLRSDGKTVERVVVLGLNDGVVHASHRTTAAQGLAWLGDTVFVTQLDFVSPVHTRSDLYSWEPGGSWRRVSHGARISDVFPAADGHLGVVAVQRVARTVSQVLFPDTTRVQFPVPPADDWGRIAVSPDGSWVAAARQADGQWDIALWPFGHPDRYRLISQDAALDADPEWSKDGRTVVFASERAGLPQIYSYDRATARTVRLTDEPTGAREPTLAANGTLLYSTVHADGYALVMQPSRTVKVGDSLAEQYHEPFQQAPRVAVRETGYVPWPALRPHFWIPFAHDEGEAGLYLGAFTMGGDAVGRTEYAAVVTAAAAMNRFESAFQVVHRRWRSWSVDFSASQTWDQGGYARSHSGRDVPISFLERSVETGVSYRLRRWRSSAALRLSALAERDELVNEGSEPLSFSPANPAFLGGVVTASAAHWSQSAMSLCPEDGVSARVHLLQRWQAGGPLSSYELRGTLSGYLALPLPGHARWVLAGNVTARVTGGSAPEHFAVGGESGDVLELVPGTGLGVGRRSFQMRGYDRGGRFTRAVVGIAELRIPVALVASGVGRLPLFLDRVSVNVFGEIGGGWSGGEEADLSHLRDVGGEVVVDLGVGAGVALRVRAGAAIALRGGLEAERGDIRYYLTFGQAF